MRAGAASDLFQPLTSAARTEACRKWGVAAAGTHAGVVLLREDR